MEITAIRCHKLRRSGLRARLPDRVRGGLHGHLSREVGPDTNMALGTERAVRGHCGDVAARR